MTYDAPIPHQYLAGGCLPRPDVCGETFPKATTVLETIPKGEWSNLWEDAPGCESYVSKIKDQWREGSCAGNSAVMGEQIAINTAIGNAKGLELSAMSVYKRTGRSSSSGSNVITNLKEIRDRGVLPLDTPENRTRFSNVPEVNHFHPATGFSRPLPSGWQETAKHFRTLEWWDIPDVNSFFTCLLKGFPVVYGRDGHSICGVRGVFRNNKWQVKYANSWGSTWNGDGFGYDSLDYLRGRFERYGAFAPRLATLPSFLIT